MQYRKKLSLSYSCGIRKVTCDKRAGSTRNMISVTRQRYTHGEREIEKDKGSKSSILDVKLVEDKGYLHSVVLLLWNAYLCM